MKMRKVIEEREQRGHQLIYQICSQTVLREAARWMCNQGCGAALVVEKPGSSTYIGILTERDILKAVAANKNLDQALVTEAMTRDLVVATVEDDAETVFTIMARKHIRHVPIMDGKKIVALISARDLLHSLEYEHEITISHLSDYTGTSHLNQVY